MPLRPIRDVAVDLDLNPETLIPYGASAKVPLAAIGAPRGKLVLVTAITPTPAGEGKTTTSVSLAMGLRKIGERAVVCLREPSLGPVFGIKGGGNGGGRATVEPGDVINLHFTGDLHAISAAHNLLAALIDNDLHFGAKTGLEPRRVTWPRVIDMNDRSLRNIVVGLGGDGAPRESRFDITAASEVMAVLCLAESLEDLEKRLGRIVVGTRADKSYVTAADLGAAPAMTALLRDALLPNLAQTAEGGPAIVHGGPFANIAHGCSSVLGTRLGLASADICITEAGFGFDLGGEKLLGIKCRSAGLWPDLVVLVVTLRALRMHGGVRVKEAGGPNAEALQRGLSNLDAHIDAISQFGLRPVVAINRFDSDPDDELEMVRAACATRDIKVEINDGFARGGEGAAALAGLVRGELAGATKTEPRFLYPLSGSFQEKLRAIAMKVYGADDALFLPRARRALSRFEDAGYGELPVCVAKTHRSLSDKASALGRPTGFNVTVTDARLLAGAGFVVALLGDIRTMPGLPRTPASGSISVDSSGKISGLLRS